MKAVRYTDAGVLLVDVEPAHAEPDFVEVRVAAAGICGSDLSLGRAGLLRVVPGHEVAGRLTDGTPVAIEPLDGCGTCASCTRGDYHLCPTGMSRMIGIGVNGGMAERVWVRRSGLVRLPSGLAPENASLVEPLAVAIHGLRIGSTPISGRIAIIGGGSIGLCAGIGARSFSPGLEVSIETRHRHQRDAAEALGLEIGTSGQYDMVIDAAGSESAVVRCLELVRPGGTLLVLSVHQGMFPMPFRAAMYKEVRIVTSFTYNRSVGGRDVDGAAALLSTQPRIAQTLITHRFALEDAAAAFEMAGNRGGGAIKVVLEPAS